MRRRKARATSLSLPPKCDPRYIAFIHGILRQGASMAAQRWLITWILALACAGLATSKEKPRLPLATATPQEVYTACKQAFASRRFELAWECLTPKMQDGCTADLVGTFAELGSERERALVEQHLRADRKTLEWEFEQQAAQPRNSPRSAADFQKQLLSILKDKRGFFVAAGAHMAQESRPGGNPPAAILPLKFVTQGNWARGSHQAEGSQQRQHVDFVRTDAGWRIDGEWQESMLRRSPPADYIQPLNLVFATPQAVFETYAKARMAADWQIAWACLTPQLQDQAAYEALCFLAQEDPHFDKVYLLPDAQLPTGTMDAAQQRRQWIALLRDKFACYTAARERQAVRESETIWKTPLSNVTITGERAQGFVVQNVQTMRREADQVRVGEERVEVPHHFVRTAAGWRLDLPR